MKTLDADQGGTRISTGGNGGLLRLGALHYKGYIVAHGVQLEDQLLPKVSQLLDEDPYHDAVEDLDVELCVALVGQRVCVGVVGEWTGVHRFLLLRLGPALAGGEVDGALDAVPRNDHVHLVGLDANDVRLVRRRAALEKQQRVEFHGRPPGHLGHVVARVHVTRQRAHVGLVLVRLRKRLELKRGGQETVYADVGVAPNGGGEVRVDGCCQAVVPVHVFGDLAG